MTDQARPEDWPSLSALTMRFGQRQGALPPAVVLPWYIQFAGQDKRIAGQTGGRMGELKNPFLVQGDPSDEQFQVQGIQLADDVPAERVASGASLLRELESVAARARWRGEPTRGPVFASCRTAFSMLGDVRANEAFRLEKEPAAVRERYGASKFGQSLLLARRLVEAGVSLVTVNWDDETRSDKVSPFWDTHNHNFAALKTRLDARCSTRPSRRLSRTWRRAGCWRRRWWWSTGEFGRTPKIGQIVQNGMTEKSGRDHWPHAFTVLLAGGGVRGGQVYGETNPIGAFVKDRPGVAGRSVGHDPRITWGSILPGEYWDEFQQMRQKLSTGRPITASWARMPGRRLGILSAARSVTARSCALASSRVCAEFDPLDAALIRYATANSPKIDRRRRELSPARPLVVATDGSRTRTSRRAVRRPRVQRLAYDETCPTRRGRRLTHLASRMGK